MQVDLAVWVQEAFDFGSGEVAITPGARGALGQVWRLSVGDREYAVKQFFADRPPMLDQVQAEVAFAQRARAAGVRLPTSYPDRNGRYLVPHPDGWAIRVYEWVDVRTADLANAPGTLGVLLARLHQCAPVADQESDGSPPDRWYAEPPAPAEWRPLVDAATRTGASWALPLADAVEGLPALHAHLTPTNPTRMRLCHRDLHPGNVLANGDGDLVVVDWDDLGPAEPVRELARTLMHCYYNGRGDPDLNSMQHAYRAYVKSGGPARLRATADFTMLIATTLNFLRRQVSVALDPTAPARDRDWAQLEIEEALRCMPTPELLATILSTLAA